MDTTKQPGIAFENVILKDLHFSRKTGLLEKPELSINFRSSSGLSPEKNKLVFELECSITEKKDLINIQCVMVGMFSQISEQENMDLETFAQNNAAALMFPYIREIIATTTARAGIPAVILPPMNVKALSQK